MSSAASLYWSINSSIVNFVFCSVIFIRYNVYNYLSFTYFFPTPYCFFGDSLLGLFWSLFCCFYCFPIVFFSFFFSFYPYFVVFVTVFYGGFGLTYFIYSFCLFWSFDLSFGIVIFCPDSCLAWFPWLTSNFILVAIFDFNKYIIQKTIWIISRKVFCWALPLLYCQFKLISLEIKPQSEVNYQHHYKIKTLGCSS